MCRINFVHVTPAGKRCAGCVEFYTMNTRRQTGALDWHEENLTQRRWLCRTLASMCCALTSSGTLRHEPPCDSLPPIPTHFHLERRAGARARACRPWSLPSCIAVWKRWRNLRPRQPLRAGGRRGIRWCRALRGSGCGCSVSREGPVRVLSRRSFAIATKKNCPTAWTLCSPLLFLRVFP